MSIFASFKILTSYLVKMATQLSLHSCPMEMSVPLFKLLKLYAILARVFNLLDSGSIAFLFGVIILPSATATCGPIVSCMLLQIGNASTVI